MKKNESEVPESSSETKENKSTEKRPRISRAKKAETAAGEKQTETNQELITELADIAEVEHAEMIDYSQFTRPQLVEALEECLGNEDVLSVRNTVSAIKAAYIIREKEERELEATKQSGEEEQNTVASDPIHEKYLELSNSYKVKKAKYAEEAEKQKLDNLSKKNQILEELRQLVESEEELKKTYDAFKHVQEKWKEIGQVPKNEINNLWQNYNFLVEKFFDKVKINKELKDLDLKKNLELKIELCEKAEELLLEPSVGKSFRELQKYHDKWRDIGPVPQEKKDEVWERFKSATEKINERRREYYDNLKLEQEKNLEAKRELCVKAEQFTEVTADSAKEWQEHTTSLNALMESWKAVGPVEKVHNVEIWTRFKTAIDAFYQNKKEFFSKLKDDQVGNYNEKVNLCIQAEAIKTSTDWKRATDELLRLQQEWRKIGPVPKKYSDKVWKRFRAACDEFFTAKSAYFQNIGSREEDNLKLKKELIQQIRDFEFGEDKNENLSIIKDFQRKWLDIGHVPIKLKNDIHNEFRDVIDAALDKLNIGKLEKSTIGFKSKFEKLAASPGAGQTISKERSFLLAKINGMKNEIKLLENNIGFFSKSKGANALRDEVQAKIDKAKEELKVFEEKLKILREVR